MTLDPRDALLVDACKLILRYQRVWPRVWHATPEVRDKAKEEPGRLNRQAVEFRMRAVVIMGGGHAIH